MVASQGSARVCVSILNWNAAADTLRCIESLRQCHDIAFDIFVLDNGSHDDSVERLCGVKDVVLIEVPQNLGFAGGHNRVMRHAEKNGYDYIWLLNNDTKVAPDCLAKLIYCAEHCHAGALFSPVIRDINQSQISQHVISLLNETRTGVFEIHDLDYARKLQVERPQEVILWGTALLIRIKAAKVIGQLDECLFAYSEDTDYSLRSINAGYLNQVVFDAVVFHHQPTGLRKPHYYYYTQRNALLMWRKYVRSFRLLRLIRWNLCLARKLLFWLEQDPPSQYALKLGIWHGLVGQCGVFEPDVKLPPGVVGLIDFLLAVA